MTRKTFKARLNAGELSPLLMARADTKVHADGLSLMANWLPLTQGGAARRPGTRYVGEGPRALGRGVRLIPFVAGPDAAYVLVFTHLAVQVWQAGGPLRGDDGGPLELATPYRYNELGGLSVAQSADVMWVCHPRHAPRLIKRLSRATFAVEAFDPDDGPFEDVRRTKPQLFTSLDPAMYVYLKPSPNSDGTHDLTSVNGSAFYSRQEGRLIRLRADLGGLIAWQPNQPIGGGLLRRVDNRVYQKHGAADGTTGTVRPTHTRGTYHDGGVPWTYLFDGYLVLRVEDWVGSTKVKVRVVPQRDLEPVSAGLFTSYFGRIDNVDVEFSSWDDYVGWPSSVAFYQERLVLARGQDVFFSKAGDFFAFADQTAGETLADDAIRATIAQDRVEAARWLVPFGGRLVIGTEGGLLAAGPATTAEPFGPGNLKVEPLTRVPCAPVAPAVYEGRLAFVQGRGSKLREAAFGYEEDGLVARDFTVLAEHLGEVAFTDLAYQAEPDPTLWLLRQDGLLLSCTREVGENVTAWARHPLPAGWEVRGLAVVPERGAERVWLALVKPRTTPSNYGQITLVRIGQRREAERDRSAWPCLDLAAGGYVDHGDDAVAGLDHLEGEEVWLRVGDGPWLPPRKVEGGRAALAPSERPERGYDRFEAGLAYASDMATPPLNLGGRARVHGVGVVALLPGWAEGLGLKAGGPEGLHPVFKTGAADADAPTLRQGRIAHGGGFTDAATLRLTADGPEPATILALTAEWEAN